MATNNVYPLKWITEFLAVGYAPRSDEHLQAIHAADIQAIVNLCGECYDLHEAEKNAAFDVFYLPVADESVPTLEELVTLIDWLDLLIGQRKKVLIHCRYGIGRTGTVVLAYLLHQGYDCKEAKELMSHTPSWPSNRVQEELIDYYASQSQGLSIKEDLPLPKSNSENTFFQRLKTALTWED